MPSRKYVCRVVALKANALLFPSGNGASTFHCLLTFMSLDLQGGALEPNQAGYQEGQAPLRSQLLPAQGLPLELRRFPAGIHNLSLTAPFTKLTALEQTWEDPNSIHPETKAKGDNDPLDVCEIGELVGYTGQVKQVKVLGVMALLDEEETDWKVIVIDVNDPLAPKLNDVEDVERHLPGLLRATNEWFRIYKIPDGKPENQFAFTGECKNKKYVFL
jgi:inorganic pyrophosphatase